MPRDAVAEVHMSALRAKLNSLVYYEHLSVDSCLLVEALLTDLTQSDEELSDVQTRAKEKEELLKERKAELDALQSENPRLLNENNHLHLQVIEATEAADRTEAEARLRLRALEDEAGGAGLALKRTQAAAAKVEEELDALRQQALDLLRPPGQAATAARSLPQEWAQTNTSTLPSGVVRDLGVKAGFLEDALRQCEQETFDIEAKIAGLTEGTETLHEEALTMGKHLVSTGPDLDALRKKAEANRARDRLAELRVKVQKETLAHTELARRRSELENDCENRQRESTALELHVSRLQQEELRVAESVRQQRTLHQSRLGVRNQRQREAQEGLQRFNQLCATQSEANRVIATEIKQLSQTEALEAQFAERTAGELDAELLDEIDRNAKESTVLETRTSHLAHEAQAAEEACAVAKASHAALETEVARAQASAEECLENLRSRMAEIEAGILDGASLQQQSHRAGAQMQLLKSSLSGLQGERDMLFTHLQDTQKSLHQEGLECLNHKVTAQRLKAVVQSLDGTRDQWSSDLERTINSLRHAHGMLSAAEARQNTAQATNARLSLELAMAGDSVEVASEQHTALSAEMQTWKEELQVRRDDCAEARSKVLEARAALDRQENEAKESQDLVVMEGIRLEGSLRVLGDEMRIALVEQAQLESARSEISMQVHQRVKKSEESMVSIQREVEEVMQEHNATLEQIAMVGSHGETHEMHAKTISEQIAKTENEVHELKKAQASAGIDLEQAKNSEQSQEDCVAKLQADIKLCEEELAGNARSRDDLERTVDEYQLQCQHLKLSEQTSQEELGASKIHIASLAASHDDLRGDVEKLLVLVSGAETTRDKLTGEVAERQNQLQEEQYLRQTIMARHVGLSEEHQVAVSELDALRQAAASLDSQRDDQQRLADIRTEEIVEKGRDLAMQQQVFVETREAVDNLQSTISSQAEKLQWRGATMSTQHEMLQSLRADAVRLQEEAHANSQEASAVVADLMNMTKENQKLHEDVRVMEQRVAGLSSASREQHATREVSAQLLQAIELERSDVVRMYQEVSLQARHQAVHLEQLKSEGESIQLLNGELRAEIARRADNEEECEAQSMRMKLDISVMEEHLEDLMGRLVHTEMKHCEVKSEDARLEGDVAMAAVARRDVGQRGALRDQATISLRLRREQLQAALRSARAEAGANQRVAEEGWQQVARLQGLFDEEKRKLQGSEAEGQALQRCCVEGSGSAASVGEMTADVGFLSGSSASASASSEAVLKEERERRYANIGDADAEQEKLLAEIARLRSALHEPGVKSST